MKRQILLLTFLFFILALLLPYFTNSRSFIYTPLAITLLSVFAIIIKYIPWDSISKSYKKDSVTTLKNIIEIFALCFAGFYFLFNFFGDLAITNLSLELITHRQKIEGTNNTYLAVDVKLAKGSVAYADLHSIKAYIYNINSSRVIDSLIFYGYERVQIIPNENFFKKVNTTYTMYSGLIDKDEKYTIASNESTQFGGGKLVKGNNPYRIEVTVIATRKKLLHNAISQFRASAISLPATDLQ
ncbi:hypothetical protein [Spirosoma sp. KNUC1025]|uniref:hypothetical protein n=1 Tax=Spirosoma sp. KNUC1025 TaxID=2894082 RepID=UPI0038671759|nr:hypothetical protein LN737_04550 [Spirosoma sp. KNUC1025]